MAKEPPPDDPSPPLPASLWEALHLPEPPPGDERFAPDVDHDLLRKLAHNELTPELVKAVYRLIYAFENWKQAYSEIVIQEFRKPGK